MLYMLRYHMRSGTNGMKGDALPPKYVRANILLYYEIKKVVTVVRPVKNVRCKHVCINPQLKIVPNKANIPSCSINVCLKRQIPLFTEKYVCFP